MRVVRFYQSCSPPRLAILLLLLRQHLLHHLCLHFHVHCCLANFAKLFANVRAQCAPLDLNLGPSQLSGHRWTSTWDLPSSVGTAGPQPGTCPAQCAPLDLNPGPSQLSVHRWTSTWDLPSSVGTAGPQPGTCPAQPLDLNPVCTAGPQPGTCPAQCAPLDLNLGPSQLSVHCWTSTWDLPSSVCTAGPQRPDRMPEDMPDKVPECLPDRMPEDLPDNMPEDMPERMPDGMPEDMPEHMPECLPEHMPEDMPDRMPDGMPEDMPGRMPEAMPDRMPDRMPEDMSDIMPEDLPVTKCINAMLGITRSKVIIISDTHGNTSSDSVFIISARLIRCKVGTPLGAGQG